MCMVCRSQSRLHRLLGPHMLPGPGLRGLRGLLGLRGVAARRMNGRNDGTHGWTVVTKKEAAQRMYNVRPPYTKWLLRSTITSNSQNKRRRKTTHPLQTDTHIHTHAIPYDDTYDDTYTAAARDYNHYRHNTLLHHTHTKRRFAFDCRVFLYLLNINSHIFTNPVLH